jgi:hypothetical protein
MRVTVSQRFASSLRRGCDYSTDLQRQPERWPGLIDLAFSLAPVGAGRHGTSDAWGAQTAGEVQLRRIDPYRLIEYTSVERGLPAARRERRLAKARAGNDDTIVVDFQPRDGLRPPVDRSRRCAGGRARGEAAGRQPRTGSAELAMPQGSPRGATLGL